MESSFHSLTPFLPLFCNCQFRRFVFIQFLCSQLHIPAGWRLEALPFTSDATTDVFYSTTPVLFYIHLCCRTLLYNHLPGPHGKHHLLSSIVLLIRCLAIDVLLLSENVFTESLPSSGYSRHSIKMYLEEVNGI
jgi:hypothetical protein